MTLETATVTVTDPTTGQHTRASSAFTVLTRVFDLGSYGADATGATLSDTAWNEAYAAASAAIQAPGSSAGGSTSGAIITAGPGIYQFSLGVVDITDARIGFLGAGKGAVTLWSSGSNGSLVTAAGGSEPAGTPAAPIGGFTLRGWQTGVNSNGLRLGNRMYSTVSDIDAWGFASTGSRGFWFGKDGILEGTDAVGLSAHNNTIGYCFDGGPSGNNSADYSHYNLHTVANGTALQVVNGAHCWGGTISLHGNAGNSLFPTSTLVQVGSSATDTAKLQSANLHLVVEADSGSTTVQDFVIEGASGNSGIVNCYGTIALLNASGTWSAGSVSASTRFSFIGPIYDCPLVAASTAYKKALGPIYTQFDSASVW